jgi:gliding motility-associated-like protein
MRYAIKYSCLTLLVLCIGHIYSQSAPMSKKITSLADDIGMSSVYDPLDNTLVILDIENNNSPLGNNNAKYKLIKFDTCLNVIWKKDLLINGQGQYGTMTYYNGTYAIYCSFRNGTNFNSLSIVTLDQSGSIISVSPSIYTGTNSINSGILGARRTLNGDHILTGSTTNNGTAFRFWFLKVALNNTVVWSQINSNGSNAAWEGGSGTDVNSNGECFFTGRAYSTNTPGNDNTHVIKTDSNGNILWAKNYGTSNFEMGMSCLATSDGGAIVFSYAGYGLATLFAMRIDALGNVVWTKLYSNTFGFGIANESICFLPNGNILSTGLYNNSANTSNMALMEVDANTGNLVQLTTLNAATGMSYLATPVVNGNNVFASGALRLSVGNNDVVVYKSNITNLFNNTSSCNTSPTITVVNYPVTVTDGNYVTSTYSTLPQASISASNNPVQSLLLCGGQKPVANFNIPNSLCLNKCLTLKDSSQFNPLNWQWTISGPNIFLINNTPTISAVCFTNTGVYTIKLVVDNCLAKDSVSKSIFIIGPNMVPIITTSPSCIGGTLSLTAPIAFTYTWVGPNSFLNNSQTVLFTTLENSQNGTYSLTSTLQNGCLNTGSVIVTANPLNTFTPSPNRVACISQSVQLNANTIGADYSWIGPNNFTSNLQNSVLNNLQPNASGIYTLIVTNNFGCSSFGTTSLSVYQSPNVIFDSIVNGCSPYCVSANAKSSTTIKTSNWYLNTSQISTSNTLSRYCIYTPEKYDLRLQVSNEFGCTSTYSQFFKVHEKPQVDFSFSPDYPNYLIPSVLILGECINANITDWAWQINDANTTYYSNTQNTNYSFAKIGNYGVMLCVLSDKGCVDTLKKIISIEYEPDLYIPNTFTPNNDGLNDVFKPVAADGIKFYELFVYNRWGELLFQSKNINEGWDGSYKGQGASTLKTEEYTYKISYKKNAGRLMEKTGNVYLLR